ncbi:MAG: Smr/MutS family protein [Lentimicrobiaceae bacterium]
MISLANFEEKTGFDIIRRMLAGYCLGEGGKLRVTNICFSNNPAELHAELNLTDEFRTMLLTVFGYPASEYFDLEEELNHILIPGTFLPAESLLLLRTSYTGYCNCKTFISDTSANSFPYLHSLLAGQFIEPGIISGINRVLDAEGNVRDNASPALLEIRKSLSQMIHQIDKKIAQALTQAKLNKYIPADTEIAIRDGRAVIPVNSSNKRKIGGVIIDESATGQTSYIEPTEVFELRNSIRELELAERREIVKILIELADALRPYIQLLKQSLDFLGRLDFLRAKALLAIETGSLKPVLREQQSFNWIQARHPLLMLSLKKQNREIIPSDISLDENNRILIISGPNAGGKSVLLKTVGLLQYMLQCGLLIPVLDTSETGIFDHLFIDIGDQQSIENDLSTYSSHLLNIKNLLDIADKSTLFLIDEFGAGTEPQSGGAIAEAVLETLNDKKAFGVVTTHYANLKLLASNHAGFINGAMLYDTKNMKPLFVLKTGRPGSSFAFEIALNISFPKEVLEKAGEKVGHAKLDFDKQMQDLEAEKLELALKEKQLQQADEMLTGLIARYTSMKGALDKKQKEILEKATDEAKAILNKSNQIIEKTIREIKQSQADANQTKKLRSEIKEFTEKIAEIPAIEPEAEKEELLPPEKATGSPVLIGSRVRMKGQHESGEVVDIHGNDATVAFNTITLKVKTGNLEVLQANTPVKKSVNRGVAYQNMVNDMNARMANFRITIDVRGKRAEEIELLIQRYIDEAIMLHVSEVSILHGKGNGVLRSIIRNYISGIPEVIHFADASLETGGSGITQVTLK